MTMLVMHVGEMRMVVNKRFVPMKVHVFSTGWYRLAVSMLMVIVMYVLMRMLKQFVDMFMFVMLSQVQPDTKHH